MMLLFEGQVIKQVVDAERCRHVFPGDVLVAINDVTVRHWPHDDVVNLLRRCRTRRFASLTLMTSRDNDVRRDPPPPARRAAAAAAAAAAAPSRPVTASPPSADPPQRVDYNELYRQIYSPVPFARVSTPETRQARSPDMRRGMASTQLVTSNGEPDVVLASRYSAPPTPDISGGSPMPRRLGPGQRREPRRSLPAQPATYIDLLSPVVQRRGSRQSSSQTSLNFSGTPDFIPASAYIEDDDRRRRATGRPSADHELAVLTLNDPDPTGSRGDEVFSSSAANTPQISTQRDDSFHSYENDEASLASSGSLRNGAVAGLSGKPPTTSGYNDRRMPAAFVGAGNETCNGYNARTEAVHSAAAVRHHAPAGHRQRSQSALADAVGPGRTAHRGPEVRLSVDGVYERPATTAPAKYGSLDRRDAKGSTVVTELTDPAPEPHTSPAISVSSSADVF